MNKEIEYIYKDFFEYFYYVNEKFSYVLDKCYGIEILFENIINNLMIYYDQNEFYSKNSELLIYLEIEECLNPIIKKIKSLIQFVNDTFYETLSCDEELFNKYIGVIYYISILEDFLQYLDSKNIDKSEYSQELMQFKNLIYNKVNLSDDFNQYIGKRINAIFVEYEEFTPCILIFKIVKTIFDKCNENETSDNLQTVIDLFLNNMTSFTDLTNHIKVKDQDLYNKVLKLENVILNLQVSLRKEEQLFDENDKEIKTAYIIELSNLYNIWLGELHRIYDLYGIDCVIKYHEIIYYASIVNDLINTFGDIEESDEKLGDYFLALYDSLLVNNLDDFEQFIDQGKDLIDDFCAKYDLITNKLEEQIEFIYILIKNKLNK